MRDCDVLLVDSKDFFFFFLFSCKYNMSNVRREANRHFRNKKGNICKTELTSLNQRVRIRKDLCRGINKFKCGYYLELTW
jgi:hypothetical protein